MLRRAILLISLFASAGPSPAQTSLAWKFRSGDTFHVEQHVLQATALEIENKPLRQKSDWKMTSRWQVKQDARESATLLVTVGSLTSKTFTGDAKVGISAREDELWTGAEFTLTVDPQGRVRAVQGHEALLKKLAGDSPERLKILTALKPPDYFQALFQDVLGPLPDRPVEPGDRWQTSAADTMSIFGTLVQTTEFTYQGPRDGLHTIDSATTSAYKAPRYAIENDVFRITKGQVKVESGKGHFLFDAAQGRVRRVQKSINLRGELTMDTLSGTQRIEFTMGTEMKIEIK